MPYFTTAELRALPDMGDTSRFPDARLVAAHDWIVAIIERECDTSFIPTTVTETLNGTGRDGLFLSSPYVRSVTSIAVDDVALSQHEVDTMLVQDGVLYYPTGTYWSAASRGNVTVTYVAGYSETPPGDLKEAALRGARYWLLAMDGWSGIDERSTSISNEYGNINMAVAGPDRPTGLPAVDATIMAWARRVRVPKVS